MECEEIDTELNIIKCSLLVLNLVVSHVSDETNQTNCICILGNILSF